jgi:hypothetical protein
MAHFGSGSNTKFYPFTWMMPKGGTFNADNYIPTHYATGGVISDKKLYNSSIFPGMMDTPFALEKSAQFNYGRRFKQIEPHGITVASGKSTEAIQKMDYSNYYNDRK